MLAPLWPVIRRPPQPAWRVAANSATRSSYGATATNYEGADLDMADDDLPPGEWEDENVKEVMVKAC